MSQLQLFRRLFVVLALSVVSGNERSPSDKSEMIVFQENEVNSTKTGSSSSTTSRRELTKTRVIDRDPPASRLPLDHCTGDCDSDQDCDEGLVCFQRTRLEPVPGCSGGTHDESFSDYCVRESDVHQRVDSSSTVKNDDERIRGEFPEIRIVGTNIFYHSISTASYPLLDECEGHCNDNNDCKKPLVCFQREQSQPVFGCLGGASDSSSQNYCIHPDAKVPASERAVLPYTSNVFRLKLYWEEGYRWQEESRERNWCMMYNYRSKDCWHGLRRETCNQDAIYISQCSNDDRQTFAFVYLEGGKEEVLIRIGSGHNSCCQRNGRSVLLKSCNENDPLQRWFAPNGNFHGYRFEISQKSYSNQCMTQAHHPKEGEVVELHSCRGSRDKDSQSSYWNVY